MTSGRIQYTWQNALRGVIIYAVGDTIAALVLGEFMLSRMLGIMCVGGTIYAFEIPNYFHWIDRRVAPAGNLRSVMLRTLLAVAYFNPLWIARHMAFILIFSGAWHAIGWGTVAAASWSFLINVPIAFVANYVIQNRMPYDWRFTASAVFSALMAIYYALSLVFF